MKWDWMVLSGNHFVAQIVLDLFAPPLLIALSLTPRYYTDQPQSTLGQKYWKHALALLYAWFFFSTLWDYFLKSHR